MQQSDSQLIRRQLVFFVVTLILFAGLGGCVPRPTPTPEGIVAPETLDIPLGIGIYDADNVAFFNQYAREDDVISVRPPFADLLKDVKVGRKMLNFNSRDEPLTDVGPVISEAKALGVTLLGYNLETVQDPGELVGKQQDLQGAAEEADLTYVFGPVLPKLMRHYEDFARYANVLVLQSQRFQTTPEYEQIVEDLIAKIKAVNPDIEVWVVVSMNPPEKPNVTPDEVISDIQLVADKADLIWLYFGPRSTPAMEEVLSWLRRGGPDRQLGAEKEVKPDVTEPRAGATVAPVDVTTPAADVFRHPMVVAIEQQTLDKYPDAESRIRAAVQNVNNQLSNAAIPREFYIDHFAPVHDKDDTTSCRAHESGGGWLPEEYCNHPGHYVFVVADEAGSRNYYVVEFPSVEWHGVREDSSAPPGSAHELFVPDSIGVLAHELGHILGLPDLYLLRVAAADNHVNNQAFPSKDYNPFGGDIMYFAPTGSFSLWDKGIIDRENLVFPARFNTWFDYQPDNTVLEIIGQDGHPLPQAEVNIYQNARVPRHGYEIDSIPEYSGRTDSGGKLSLGSNVLGGDRSDALKVFLIEIKFNGQVDYQWFCFMDVNFAFWNEEDVAIEANIRSQD